jgi:MFS family permease
MPIVNYFREFAPRAQSAFVRRAYARELVGEMSFTFPMAMLAPGVVGIIATLLFDIGSLGLATIVAAPMFANLTSTLWARLGHGRSRARVLAGLQATLLLVVALIALLPAEPSAAAALVGLYVLARCVFAGVLTTRTVIWRANYPRHSRSRITGRLMLINTFMLATVPIAAAELFDEYQKTYPWTFRAVYLSAAAVGVVGVVAYAGLRVRRERALRSEERNPTIGSGDQPGPPVRVSALHVLRTDRHFRSYMTWQFMAGVATMAGNTAMIAFVAAQVKRLPDGWHRDVFGLLDIKAYMVGIVLASAIMQLFVSLSIPFFAHYLDKVHVTRFRTRHGLLWIFTQATSLAVAYLAAVNGVSLGWLLVLIAVPRIGQGLVFGGGRLAWQLGHHDFADRHLAATYMAIHQTLTGIRGFVAPFFGVLLYTGWDAYRNVLGTGVSVPAWRGIGHWVFAITLAFAIIGWLGFVRLDKQVGGDGAAKAHD